MKTYQHQTLNLVAADCANVQTCANMCYCVYLFVLLIFYSVKEEMFSCLFVG